MDTLPGSSRPRHVLWTNVAFLIAQNVLSPMFAMVLVVAISRLQGAGALGRYSLALAFFAFGEAFAGLGLNVLITRYVATNPREAGRFVANTLAVALSALAAGLAIVLPAVIFFVADRELRISMLLLTMALPASVLITYGQAALLGLDHAKDLVVIDLLEGIARAVIATGAVLAGSGLIGIVLVVVGTRVLAAAGYFWGLRVRDVRIPLRIELSECRKVLSQTFVFATIPIVNALYARLDLFMLGRLAGVVDVGYYNAAGRFQDAVRPLPRSYVRALYSTLSRADQVSQEKLLQESRRALLLVLSCLLPASILLAGLAEPLTLLVYGEKFRSAASACALFGWLIVPYGMSVLLAHVLFATGNQAFDLRVNIAALFASAAVNAFAIPRWGTAGAAGAALVVSVGYAASEYWFVQKKVGDLKLGWPIIKIFLAGAGAYGVVAALRDTNLIVSFCAGLITYLAGLWLAGVFGQPRVETSTLSGTEQLVAEMGSE